MQPDALLRQLDKNYLNKINKQVKRDSNKRVLNQHCVYILWKYYRFSGRLKQMRPLETKLRI